MLGKLARWLRLAGFDTAYDPRWGDRQLAALARAEGRWLLTRDRRLAAAAGPRVLLLAGETLPEQVRELRTRLELAARPELFFTRCSRCNAPLVEVSRGAVAHLVPPYVAAHAPRFVRCLGCGQMYWPGSHVTRMTPMLAELFLGR